MRAAAPAKTLFADGRGRVLLFCWLGWVFDFHDLILFSFTKGLVAQELGLGAATMAWIEGAGLFASALGGLGLGRMADRIGRRRALCASILVYSLGALLTATATGPWSLLLARLCTGLGVGGEWGIGHAVVAETWSGRDRDRVHGLLQAGSPLAMALAAGTGLFAAPVVGWRTVFLCAALPALLVFMARRAMPGADRPPVAGSGEVAARALVSAPHRRATLVLLAILVLHMTGFWCVYAELPAALLRDLRVQPAQAGTFQIAVNLVHVVADILFGVLAARAGRLRVFAWFCVGFAAAQLLLAWQWQELTADFLWFTVAAALMGLGAGTWSCFGALFGAHYPPALRATAAALLFSLARSSQLFAKPLAEALGRAYGSMQPALWIGAACALGSAALLRLLPSPRQAD